MKKLTSVNEIKGLFELSTENPIIIFKHSDICPSSLIAYQEIEKLEKVISVPIYICVVQENRKLSNLIEEKTSVKHETPQVILIYKNKSVVSWDHSEINKDVIFDSIMKI